MYGGHITDDWDRRLCRTYLEVYMNPQMFDGELYLAPGFLIPPNFDYKGYHKYIDEAMPAESPSNYGLHPNAEIDFLTTKTENLFRTVLEMQPRDIGKKSGNEGSQSRDDKVLSKCHKNFISHITINVLSFVAVENLNNLSIYFFTRSNKS